MAGIGPGDLYALADELLQVCTEALDTIPDFPDLTDLAGAPNRRFVSPGPPIPDCSQLTVHAQGINDRFSREAKPEAPKLNVPNLVVTLLRCAHNGTGEGAKYKPPTSAQQSADAQQHLADAWALWNHIYNLIRAEQFLTHCERAAFLGMVPVRLEGGLVGWQLNFNAQLDGYEEDLGT